MISCPSGKLHSLCAAGAPVPPSEMVKIYLHPEIEAMWADSGSAGPPTPNADAAAAAQKLLADVRIAEGTATQHQVRSWAWGAAASLLGTCSCSSA